MKSPAESHPLTESQRKLVSENLPLISVHLKRHFANRLGRQDPDEWNELFQDGCLGLIDAARTFDPGGRGKFAAHALYRIHSAVSGSLRRRRSSVRLPDRVGRRSADAENGRTGRDANPSTRPITVPRVVSRTYQALDSRPSDLRTAPELETAEGDPLASEAGPTTIGESIRAKIEAAGEIALVHAHDAANSRTDRRNLARDVVEHRLMVPEEEARASLREIAERTGSSYGRVAHCEATLLDKMRDCLAEESELALLRESARREIHGLNSHVDSALRTRLLDAAAAQAMSLFTRGSRDQRARMLLAVVERLVFDVTGLFRTQAAGLSPGGRTAWLAHLKDLVDNSKDAGTGLDGPLDRPPGWGVQCE